MKSFFVVTLYTDFFVLISFLTYLQNSTEFLQLFGVFFNMVRRQGASCHVKVVDLGIGSLFSQVYYSLFYSLPDIITRAECVVSYKLRFHSN